MCGIAGYVGRESPGVLPAMLRALDHRGPDDRGTFEDRGVGLGASRLAIIDLEGGRQPMASEDGSLRIVFNGEIYNHRALRSDLEARGHRFATRSDTEVILHLFEDAGEHCVEPLRGMFALAIWDVGRRRLFLARDRLGKKPLYYWHRDGLFLFASEIKALLCHPDVSRDVDWEALHHYLAFGWTPGARSIFAGIAKLPPAHTAMLDDDGWRTAAYWSLPPPAPPAHRPGSLADAAALVRQEVREAVRLRLESDVPVGVFLSGGIDSSAVVACVREITSGRVATFSIGFGDGAAPSYDELPYARLVARRFATDHHEEILSPKVADLIAPIVRGFDEPFADSSAVPTFVIAQATAQHVKVALSGIGGDEAFAGYPRYSGVRLSEIYARVPGPLRSAIGALLVRLVPESQTSRDWGSWIRRFVAGADQPLPDRYVGWTRLFGESEIMRLAAPALRERWGIDVAASHRAAFQAARPDDPVDGAIRVDLTTYLPDDLLVMADRMSMAHSLEVRAPFCDHRVIEAALGLPSTLKMDGPRLKRLLKAAFADVLPPEILARPKQGFMIPLARWLRTDLADVMEDLLAPERVRARRLFDPELVEGLKRDHRTGGRSHADRLWTLMVLEVWMREYLDRGRLWTLP